MWKINFLELLMSDPFENELLWSSWGVPDIEQARFLYPETLKGPNKRRRVKS